MSDPTREAFLTRVRQAVRDGNRAGVTPPLPERGTLAYQGGGPDPVALFCRQLEAAGGVPHRVPDLATATAKVRELLRSMGAKRVLVGNDPLLTSMGLASALSSEGLTVTPVASLTGTTAREAFFAADVSVTGAKHLIAETGSLVVECAPGLPRSESLLPPIHLVVADRSRLLADLFDVFPPGREMPSALTIITGPSKTGDIELKLVTGVHGPGEVHVVFVEAKPLIAWEGVVS